MIEPQPALVLEQLSLSYGRRRLWQIEAAQWSAGQLIWLQGTNGAGKTSLMKVISGLLTPTQGRVRRIHHVAEPQAMCYLHQQPYVFSTSVRRNLEQVLSSRYLQAVPVDERHRRLEAALVWAQLSEQADQPARTLSGGERQRLALARAHILQPRFWLLDEPSANLDQQAVQLLATLIQDVLAAGCGILLTAHQSNAITDLAQCIWRLDQQQLSIHPGA